MIAAAMGLRTAFCVQAKSTAPGSSSPLGPRIAGSAFQMQYADERKKAPCRIEIHIDRALALLLDLARAAHDGVFVELNDGKAETGGIGHALGSGAAPSGRPDNEAVRQ